MSAKEETKTDEPVWEKREFAINEHMREAVKLAKKAAEAELHALRKRLRKLQYGG